MKITKLCTLYKVEGENDNKVTITVNQNNEVISLYRDHVRDEEFVNKAINEVLKLNQIS